jgi:nicotinate (nicotinamide) nucleotide adenylyltransferase
MLPIAVGGSAANPPTIGHYRLIEWLLNCGMFSAVIWILSGSRSDKQNLVDPNHRVAVTLLTFPQEWFLRTDVQFVPSFEDVYGKNQHTIAWLRRIQKMHPNRKIVWYTGVDSVIPKKEYGGLSEMEACWIEGTKLVKEWDFLVFPRAGLVSPHDLNLGSNFEIANANLPEVSSSEVRRRIAAGESFEELMLSNASQYIKQHGLYGYQRKGIE